MARNEKNRIGVFVCHCGVNISAVVDVDKVVKAASVQEGVVVARDYKFMCSTPGQELILADIKELDLNRIIVAACSPRLHEETFKKVLLTAGLNAYFFQMANIREQNAWVTEDKEKATEKAISLVSGAIQRIQHHEPLPTREVDINPDVLVIGGGIAGIEASLQIADAGHNVTLVEKEPSIGGHMAQFDKTFPTLDCSACILTPKMNSVGTHPKIDLLTSSAVTDVSGYIGNFDVTVKTKARYVNHDLCTSCGACLEKCPVKIPSEFDEGMDTRGAIYTLFPQGVPNKPVIDAAACLKLTKNKCGLCEKVCEPNAINFEDQEKEINITVGSIIVATGYKFPKPAILKDYGYGVYDNVLTGPEFERINNAAGPSGGEILLKDGSKPRSAAILHCIGSRDKNVNEYCSKVCCMYSLKFSHLVKEKTGAEVFEFYIDMRAAGKGYEEFYDRIREEDVHFIRGKVGSVTDVPINDEEKGKLVVIAENTLAGKRLRVPVDMVILSTGLECSDGVTDITRMLKLSIDKDGFFIEKHPKLAPTETASDGIYIAGCSSGPKDIPESVASAQATAAMALKLISKGKVEVEATTAWIDEELCAGCKICVNVCPYNAIEYDEGKSISVINEVLCKGCGTCAATCPISASSARHFNDQQILNEIEGVLQQ
jgi:heterodisulfide reductase subunit A